jgi:ferric-dicitrate binding protein FerR (iron transport regulator)
MLNQHDIEIIQRYLAGQASEPETNWVENLFAGGAVSPGLHKYLHEDFDTLQPGTDIPLTHLLDRVHHIIRLKELEQKRSVTYRFIHIYSRVAAVLLLPVLLAGLWFYFMPKPIPEQLVEQTVNSTIYAPLGSRVAFNLPDGTTGFLNSGSSLSYPIPFASNRNVTLQGEAWFDVAQDEQHPFEIGAGTSAVRVLGTSFNLSAYPDENYVEVVLAEGSVEFCPTAHARPVLLQPSDRLVFNGESIHVEKTEIVKYFGWTEGKLIFRGDNMSEVARRLERWYNIEVEIADKELEDYVFRGTFEDDNLKDVLKLLSMTSRIRYQITPRRQIEGDRWSKEKVTLFFRK